MRNVENVIIMCVSSGSCWFMVLNCLMICGMMNIISVVMMFSVMIVRMVG